MSDTETVLKSTCCRQNWNIIFLSTTTTYYTELWGKRQITCPCFPQFHNCSSTVQYSTVQYSSCIASLYHHICSRSHTVVWSLLYLIRAVKIYSFCPQLCYWYRLHNYSTYGLFMAWVCKEVGIKKSSKFFVTLLACIVFNSLLLL